MIHDIMVVNKTCPQHFTKDKFQMAVSTWIVEGVAKHFGNWDALGNNENKKGWVFTVFQPQSLLLAYPMI